MMLTQQQLQRRPASTGRHQPRPFSSRSHGAPRPSSCVCRNAAAATGTEVAAPADAVRRATLRLAGRYLGCVNLWCAIRLSPLQNPSAHALPPFGHAHIKYRRPRSRVPRRRVAGPLHPWGKRRRG